MKPVFYLLAGPNGAGKSTLYKALFAAGQIPKEAEFVNADLHEAVHLQHIADAQQRSEAARQWADQRRDELLATGKSFVSETVFSHESKLVLIEEAQKKGFFVLLLVVCMDDPKRLLKRVSQRVSDGGFDQGYFWLVRRCSPLLCAHARPNRLSDRTRRIAKSTIALAR
ncbi:MAG: zeta toxin family protein, partial [Brachymonas sp.]